MAPATTIRLETRTGAYIHRGETLLRVWPVPDDADAVTARLLATVEIADNRTMQQDVDFALRQLVDVALRALSSAINDPTTAAEVVLRLGSILRILLVSPVPPLSVAGTRDRVLQCPWLLSHEEYIEHAFDQIRQAGRHQPHVVAVMLRVMRMLIDHVHHQGRPEHVPALQRQIRLLMEGVRTDEQLHPEDLQRLELITTDASDPAEHRKHRPPGNGDNHTPRPV